MPLLFAGAAVAGELPGGEARQAIRQVIERQLQAFRADDGEAAFAQASPMIRGQFGTAENFMRMVRTGYPPVYRARRAEFRELALLANRIVQPAALFGADGKAVMALYLMEAQPDGSWRIDGCSLLDLGEEGA